MTPPPRVSGGRSVLVVMWVTRSEPKAIGCARRDSQTVSTAAAPVTAGDVGDRGQVGLGRQNRVVGVSTRSSAFSASPPLDGVEFEVST